MTIQELYAEIGGDYNQAIRVLRMDKLIDKHIRKLPKNGVVEHFMQAGKTMNPTELFETAHAVKGICANLGLTALSGMASEIAEEFRPSNQRTLSDSEVSERIAKIETTYQTIKDGILKYENS